MEYMHFARRQVLLIILTVVLVGLTACGGQTPEAAPELQPTVEPSPQPTGEESVLSPQPADDEPMETAQPADTEEPAAQDNTTEGEVDINCTETNPHPMGQSIAATFEVTYEEVMTWFCSGYAFDDILLALETADLTDYPAEDLLQMNEEKSWDQIWEELGIVSGGE